MCYLSDFDNFIRDERQMKSLTGASTEEYKYLIPYFKAASEEMAKEKFLKGIKEGKRKRKSGAGIKGKLDSYGKQLFYILNYVKVYPTFDVQGTNYGYSRGRACEKVHELIWVLIRMLRNLGVAPKRKIECPEDFQEIFGEVDKLIVDATERRHYRHKNYEKQKENYSGKKNVTQKRI